MSFSLYLYAEQSADATVSTEKLIKYLSEIEFLDLSVDAQIHLPGKQLMDYITFLGCSPSLKLGEIESTIRFFYFDHVNGLGGESIETIKYPLCKHQVDQPSKLLSKFADNPYWHCPVCGQEGKINEINWRKTAGFSKLFIEVSQIFPKEAIPSDKLLDTLLRFTKTDWK